MASTGPAIPSAPAFPPDPEAPPPAGPVIITLAWDPDTDDVRVQGNAAATVLVGILSRALYQTNVAVANAVAQLAHRREQRNPRLVRATS